MNKFKKNQIVIYAIVLMLVVAGYLNYIGKNNSLEISAQTQNNTNIGDATLVSNNNTEEDKSEKNSQDKAEEKPDKDEDENEKQDEDETQDNNSETENTNSNITTNTDLDEYFTNSKIEREKMYSQMLETYQKILENSSVSEEQKSIASDQITKINNTRNAIMICENLISIKGFEESVILANGDNINIVVKAEDLNTEEIAQIQNIITREMSTSIENIHIMKK